MISEWLCKCSVGKKKGGGSTPINFNINYRREMKLISIDVNYCLLEFDALKFFLGGRLHGGLNLTLIFLNVNPQI